MAKSKDSFNTYIIENFGEKVLDNHTKKIEAISTGCLSLDTSIGVGGIPRGMITEMFGPEGSGKTTIALNTAKWLAEKGGKTLYIDIEQLLNTELLRTVLGQEAKVENITIVTPDSAEDAFMIAEKGISSQEFGLIVIDSIGAMASKKEKEIEFDKDTMGQLPKLVGRFIKRNIYDIRTTGVSVLILNQIRDNVGVFTKVKSYKTPGGHQLQHEAAVRIALSRGENLKRGKEIVGILTKFTVKKNKLAPPFRSFTVPIIFGKGIDFLSDFLDFAKLLGVISSAGPYYKFEDITLGKGKAEAREYLLNSQETVDMITEKVYNVVNEETNIADILNDLEDEIEDQPLEE